MVKPMPRASGGTLSAPSFPGAGGSFPGCAGDACLWYSVGCFIGCPACSSTGKDMYATPATNGDDGHGGPCAHPMEPTNNNATQRTNNVEMKSIRGDWTSLPPLKGSPVVWKAGQAVEVGWAMSANHGGGYQYRVCPKGAAEPTEECFQAHVLPFVGDTTTISHFDGREDVEIPAVTFSTGTKPAGSAWRKNPIPMCNCDLGQACSAKGGARVPDALPRHIDVLGPPPGPCMPGCGAHAPGISNV
eukprot:gene2322-7029_t